MEPGGFSDVKKLIMQPEAEQTSAWEGLDPVQHKNTQ